MSKNPSNRFLVSALSLMGISFFAFSEPTYASAGSYGASVITPTIPQTNFVKTSSQWAVPSIVTSSDKITKVTWSIKYKTPSKGTLKIKICNKKSGCMDNWSNNRSGSTTYFSGDPATSPFYFQAKVSYTKTIVQKVLASGMSTINVNYK